MYMKNLMNSFKDIQMKLKLEQACDKHNFSWSSFVSISH